MSATATEEIQKILRDNQNGRMKWHVTGRVATGLLTGFGPVAFIGDFTRAVENGFGIVEAVLPGGLLGQPERKP